jgi:uncharacterized cofD-like protein
MAGDAEDPLTKAFKVRFGFAEGHTLGNLMLSALEVTSGGFPQAIDICEKLLNARGHVYPSTLDRVTLVAQTRDGRMLEGQAVANHSRTALRKVALRSEEGILPYQPAIDAIRQADLVVLGPGSLYTSIIPNLLVPGIVDAIRETHGSVVFVCSLADMQGETRGMNAREHYEALVSHGLKGLVDFMLVHDCAHVSLPESHDTPNIRGVAVSPEDLVAIRSQGTRIMLCDLVEGQHPTWHDPVKLRRAFSEIVKLCRSTRM